MKTKGFILALFFGLLMKTVNAQSGCPGISIGSSHVTINRLVYQGVTYKYQFLNTTYQSVTMYGERLIYIPNTFTPDGFGINDLFIPGVHGVNVNDYELLIFNRWGELIFQSPSYEAGWDGTHKGIKVKQDVYVWKLKVKNYLNEEKKEYIGNVNLLR